MQMEGHCQLVDLRLRVVHITRLALAGTGIGNR